MVLDVVYIYQFYIFSFLPWLSANSFFKVCFTRQNSQQNQIKIYKKFLSESLPSGLYINIYIKDLSFKGNKHCKNAVQNNN